MLADPGAELGVLILYGGAIPAAAGCARAARRRGTWLLSVPPLPMPRFRLIVRPLGKPRGPWRDCRARAVADALDAGLAHRDDYDPERIWWNPLAEIEEAAGDCSDEAVESARDALGEGESHE